MHHVLTYDYVSDYLERRGLFRAEHLALGRAAVERGVLLLGGTTDDPPTGALFVFDVTDRSAVEDFALADPYVTNGLVAEWRIRAWTTVLGEDAQHQVRPD